MTKDAQDLLAEARRALGIENLVLMIHDASFPSRADEEVGRGSPYARGAQDLLAWAEDRGFTGVQLGPQGITSADDKSPYDGTAFAKNPMSIALAPLVEEGLLEQKTFDEIRAGAPPSSERVDYARSWTQSRRAVKEAHARADRTSALWQRFVVWRAANASWLARDEDFEAWSAMLGTDDWRRWPSPLPAVNGDEVFAFGQFLVHAQHEEFRRKCRLQVLGDLQIGISHRDRF